MIDRRGFFRIAAGAGTASLAAACKWDGGDAVRPRLLDISRVNDWVGEKLLYSPSRLAREHAAHDVHGQTPLRRGVDGDLHLARRRGLGRRRALRVTAGSPLRALRVVRRRLLERLGLGERDAPADDPRLRHERQSPGALPRRAAALVRADQAGL